MASSPAPTPPSGGRHLKRLSLSTSSMSLSSAGSPTLASSSRTASPASATAQTPSRSRSLRLSVNGSGGGLVALANGGSLAGGGDNLSPMSAPADATAFATSNGESPLRRMSLHQQQPPQSAGPGTGSFSARPLHTPTHVKRMSSISYSSSPRGESADPASPSPPPTAGGGLVRSASLSQSLNSPSHSPTSSLGNRQRLFHSTASSTESPASSPLNDRFQHPAHATTPSATGSLKDLKEEEEDNGSVVKVFAPSGEPETTPSSSTPTNHHTPIRMAPTTAPAAQPTLTELHSDLLSFIAKKERRCLDLREELKKQEGELSHLKKKWEAIVAKSLSSAAPPTTTSLPRLSPSLPSVAAFTSSSSSNTKAPRSPGTQHTLDLSLLSSTFNSGPDHPEPAPSKASSSSSAAAAPALSPEAELDKEIGESVSAAKAWMGGVLGKVMDTISGIEEPLRPQLHALKEEEEEDETTSRGKGKGPERRLGSISAASASSAEDRRRDSRASTTSTTSASELSDISSFGFSISPKKSSIEEQRISNSTSHGTTSSSSTSSIFSLAGFTSPEPAPPSPETSRTPTLGGPPRSSRAPPSSSSSSESQGHNRRRSTFDMLGSAAGGGWSSLGKKWAAVADSDTFKGTKRATLNFVDTFERTLTETLGPLEPGAAADGHHPSSTTTSSSMSADQHSRSSQGGDVDKTPKPHSSEQNWDWSSLLDGTPPTVSSAPADGSSAPKVVAYRRPSLTSPAKSSNSTTSRSSQNQSKSLMEAETSSKSLSENATGKNKIEGLASPVREAEDEWGW